MGRDEKTMATTEIVKATDDKNAAAAAPVSLGKGAWDCDNNCEIPPDKEAEVFEEIATMDFPYEGIPTIPPRKNMTHMAFFCNGCRYRVEAYPDWTARQVNTLKLLIFSSILLRFPLFRHL